MTQVVSFECYRWYHLSDIINDEKIKRIREKRRRLEQEIAAMTAKRKEEHRIWMELMGFAKEEEKKEIDKDKL